MAWVWIVGAVLVLAAGAMVPAFYGRRRLRADGAARARHEQLGRYVQRLTPTDDPVMDGVLIRARERWVTAGTVLATARTDRDYDLAERICDEGLALVEQAHHP
ncbi:hypothetical protein [Actinocrispum sp. NPDC049592]|uniref:hypothetical protein n=1 Tax=Actinocrispum sp. NPDC049592 TaxID=3154835 RepID=UPI003439AB0B